MPKKSKGGISYSELIDISNLKIGSNRPDFNHTAAARSVKTSNFAGGAMQKILKETYTDYKKGKKSKLRNSKFSGGFPAELNQIYNISGLGIGSSSYKFNPVVRINRPPYSHFSIY